MSDILVDLFPLIIGAAVLPLWIIIGLFLLTGENGALKTTAFAAGAMTVRLVQGIFFGYFFGSATEGNDGGATIITDTLLTVVGIVLLITAYKKWRKEEDPDAPPPGWMEMLNNVSALKGFGMGVLLMMLSIKQWVFTLSAIALIEEGQLGRHGSILAYLFFVVAAQSLVLTPVGVSLAAPIQSANWLDASQRWLQQYSRGLTITVSLIFGIWFLWKGIANMLV